MRGTNHFCLLKDQAQCFAKRSLNKFFHMDFFLETFKLLSLILAYLDTVPENLLQRSLCAANANSLQKILAPDYASVLGVDYNVYQRVEIVVVNPAKTV